MTSVSTLIVTDAPSLAIRITQAGAQGSVAAADSPELHQPPAYWLKSKMLFLVSYKKGELARLNQPVRAIDLEATPIQLTPDLRRSAPASLRALGNGPEVFEPRLHPSAVAPLFLKRPVASREYRMPSGNGVATLKDECLQSDER
jgi:hypothetical protein